MSWRDEGAVCLVAGQAESLWCCVRCRVTEGPYFGPADRKRYSRWEDGGMKSLVRVGK